MYPRSLARRGRTLLLWTLAGFVAIQLTLGLAIETGWTVVRDPDHVAKLHHLRERQHECPNAQLVLALGSSRTLMGLDAGAMCIPAGERPVLVYNYGLAYSGPVLQLVTLRRLLAEGVRPDALLLEITPIFYRTMPGRLWDEKMLDGTRLRIDELVDVLTRCKEPSLMFGKWCLGRGLPCYRHAAELQSFCLGESCSAAGTDGYGWQAVKEVTPERRAELTRHVLGDNGRTDGQNEVPPQAEAALRAVLELCRTEGIPVRLYLMPEGSAYRGLYSEAFLARLDRLVQQMCQEYRISCIDARKDWVDDEGFSDSHHLMACGARTFTQRFNREVLPWVQAVLRR